MATKKSTDTTSFHGWSIDWNGDTEVTMTKPYGDGTPLFVNVSGATSPKDAILEEAKFAALEEDLRVSTEDDRSLWQERHTEQSRIVSLGKTLRPVYFGSMTIDEAYPRLRQLGWREGDGCAGVPSGAVTLDGVTKTE